MSKNLTIGLFALLFIASGVQSLAISKMQNNENTNLGNTSLFNDDQQAAVGLYDVDSSSPERESYSIYDSGGNDCSANIYDDGEYLGTLQGWTDKGDESECMFSWAYPTSNDPLSGFAIKHSNNVFSVVDDYPRIRNEGVGLRGEIEPMRVSEVIAFKAVVDKLKLEKPSKSTIDFIEKINKSVFAENYTTGADDPEEFPWLCRQWVGEVVVGADGSTSPGDSGHWHYFFCNISVRVRLL